MAEGDTEGPQSALGSAVVAMRSGAAAVRTAEARASPHGSAALAGLSTLGLIQHGYKEHTATAVTVTAGKVGAATITALVLADRRKKTKKKQLSEQLPAAEPQRRVPPSAPADEQPGTRFKGG